MLRHTKLHISNIYARSRMRVETLKIITSVVPAAEIRDHETGLVSGPFSWFQSRQKFHETHETEANRILLYLSIFLYVTMLCTRNMAL